MSRLSPNLSKGTDVSIITPTYKESGNIVKLCESVFQVCKTNNLNAELLVMEDESSDTKIMLQNVNDLQKRGFNIALHTRNQQEGRGLSSAVLLGFDKARYEVMICMDADMQHDPAYLPALVQPIAANLSEFTMGSRNVDGGGLAFEWSMYRRIVSWGATILARGLTNATDPMSGFFGTTKSVLRRGRAAIDPIGFKIGLEIISRCNVRSVYDVPIKFQERHLGESKLSAKQNALYLRQVIGLYWSAYRLFVLVILGSLALFIRYVLN